MKITKRILSILLCGAFILSFVGCDESNSKKETNQILQETTPVIDDIEYSDEVKLVLSREIYIFKNDFPEYYTQTIYDITETISYVDNWTFEQLLNDNNFDNIAWSQKHDDLGCVVTFKGCTKINSNISITAEFLISNDAELPLFTCIVINDSVNETCISSTDFINKMEPAFALASCDASCTLMLVISSEDAIDSKKENNDANVDIPNTDSEEDIYSLKINEYITATEMDIDSFDEKYDSGYDNSSINALMVRNNIIYGGTISYTIYDIDDNGELELLISDTYSIIDVYTIRLGKLVKLVENCNYGERVILQVLSSGEFLRCSSTGASNAQFEIYIYDELFNSMSPPTFAYYYDENGPNSYMYGYEYLKIYDYDKKLEYFSSKSMINEFDWKIVSQSSGMDDEELEDSFDDEFIYIEVNEAVSQNSPYSTVTPANTSSAYITLETTEQWTTYSSLKIIVTAPNGDKSYYVVAGEAVSYDITVDNNGTLENRSDDIIIPLDDIIVMRGDSQYGYVDIKVPSSSSIEIISLDYEEYDSSWGEDFLSTTIFIVNSILYT